MRFGLTLALLTICAWPIAAQTWEDSACLDTVSAPTRVPVFLGLRVNSPPNARPTYGQILLDLVAERVRTTLGGSAERIPAADSVVHWRKQWTHLHVTHRKDGSFAWQRVTREPADQPAIALVERALTSAHDAGELLPWDDATSSDSIEYDLLLERPTISKEGTVKPIDLTLAVPVFSMRVPWEEPVAPRPGHRSPKYPESARNLYIEGSVLMQFMVDTAGHPEPESARDLWPEDKPRYVGAMQEHYESFLSATKTAIRRMRFSPAVVGGCKLRQVIQQPFNFTLR
jgi:hypothetical protein